MAATIRLMRLGKKGAPYYRIVVVDHHKKRNGVYLENLGVYNPLTTPAVITVNEKKLTDWLLKGAMVSEGMNKIFGRKIRSIKNTFKKD